jgi:hypothetical protein
MRSRLSTTLVAVAWVAVGGASLYSINALADGLNGRRAAKAPPTSPVTEATPTFGQLLGGPDAEAPPEPPAPPTPPPAVEQEASAGCLTFEDVLASLDRAPVSQQGQGEVQAVEAANPDIVWCEGVREGFMLALASPAPPRKPEAPRGAERIARSQPPDDGGGGPPPGDVGGGEPPGGDGGPGYTG